MDLMESIVPEIFGGKAPDLLVAVLATLIAGLIAVFGREVWRSIRKRLGVKDTPQPVFIAPDPDAVAKDPSITLPRPTAHYVGDAALIRHIMATLEQSHTASLVGLAGMVVSARA